MENNSAHDVLAVTRSTLTDTPPIPPPPPSHNTQIREKVLHRFRDGKFSVLVATDVAARGLDIPDVDLVVHYELPQEPEAFLHRSGRTGRAGRSGTTIAMFTHREVGYFKRVLRETETSNIEYISPPSPKQVCEGGVVVYMAVVGHACGATNRLHSICSIIITLMLYPTRHHTPITDQRPSPTNDHHQPTTTTTRPPSPHNEPHHHTGHACKCTASGAPPHSGRCRGTAVFHACCPLDHGI